MPTVDVGVARSPLPANIADYAGKWVAIRAGEVIASADEFDELIADERVLADDALYHVPEAGVYFY